MFCWILGSSLVLAAGVLGQVNTNDNGWLNCDSMRQVSEEIKSCDIGGSFNTPDSFITDDTIRGKKIISAVTTTCRNYPLIQKCISNVTAKCGQLDSSLMTAAARVHSRLCNGSQPLDWYLNVMTDDFEAKTDCVVPLVSETMNNCSVGEPPFREGSVIPVSAWLQWAESYMSSILSCLMTDLENTIAKYTTCNVQATELIMVFYSFMSVKLGLGFSPTDNVFESLQSFVAPPSKRDSWAYDWLFNNGRQ